MRLDPQAHLSLDFYLRRAVESMCDRETVFVYGSLRRGMAQLHLITGAPFLGYGSTADTFTLYDSGDWPAAITTGVTAIYGELYDLSTQELALIDAYERHPHFFCRKRVKLADRRITSIWIYTLDIPEHWKRIGTGDWVRYTADA